MSFSAHLLCRYKDFCSLFYIRDATPIDDLRSRFFSLVMVNISLVTYKTHVVIGDYFWLSSFSSESPLRKLLFVLYSEELGDGRVRRMLIAVGFLFSCIAAAHWVQIRLTVVGRC